ncbi:hypothetical protein M408DRAFT_327125 [Serendipita vermifera MAFF 305830]|uniref:U3 small nucleolar RNA-associated protein 25 n=1 Tax=Serendipita vermifera MAFF 305830 TaxID=933852 RepID=A0A0C3BJL9_SERVB|nr:hypothetical protein M408DRAFT_327125 [Serendipita vermifera MAFF 305830]
MATAESHELVTTRLLTLLNVSALSPKKRKRAEEPAVTLPPSKKLNAKKDKASDAAHTSNNASEEDKDAEMGDGGASFEDSKEPEVENDPYKTHFGPNPPQLTEQARASVDKRSWVASKRNYGKVGDAHLQVPDGQAVEENHTGLFLLDKLKPVFEDSLVKNPGEGSIRKDLLQSISSYQDLYITKQDIAARKLYREVVSAHVLNHILKIRRRILKHNEKLSSSKDAQETEPTAFLDQGFVRPSVLIVLPFRSSAKHWVTALLQQTPSHQVENKARFSSDFSIPNGTEEKLLTAPPGTYPPDHVANMSGNIDDHFRLGIKVTRKSIKLFSDFYSSDIILASPLGLRELMDKEKSADYLSSIEILVLDQLDVLTMQNWSHLEMIFTYLNTIPKQSHDTDFSRIKPWYLDGHARYLRQSLLFTAYETPEIRGLYNRHLHNVSGKRRIESAWSSIQVPEGIRQNYIKFECANAQAEINQRFEYFTTQLFPSLLKSAVQSVNTVIFVPSYFDYARIRNWLKNQAMVTFAILSEDSDNRDISRARQAFFLGNKAMLLVTERFHFFRRYKLRGIRNLVFYAPPDHPQFYSELLSYPFLDDGVQPEDVTCKVLYSKYDYMRLERIVGSAAVGNLISG